MSKKTATLPPPEIPRYGLYRRVSDASQVEQDLSLPAQRRLQHEYVSKVNGVAVAEFEDGGISGTKAGNRQGFQDAIAAARRREFDVLLIHKSDRVFRNRFDAVTYKVLLREHGVALESVTEPWVGGDEPGEKLLEGVMECVNEFYSANLSRETKKGLQQIAVAHGRQGGKAPYGYEYANIEAQGSGWVIVEAEAVWLRRAFRRVLEGAAVAGIAREFNAAAVPTYSATPRGKSQGHPTPAYWTPAALRSMLRNRAYVGEVVQAGVRHPGAHEPIVDPQTFEDVQARIARRPPRRSDQSERGLFVGGTARCPNCGSNLVHQAEKNEKGEYFSRYRCYSAHVRRRAAAVAVDSGGCGGYQISQRRLTALLIAGLTERASGRPSPPPASAPRAVQRLSASRDAERAGFEEQLDKLDRMRQGYIDLAAEGILRVDELRGRLAELEGRRAQTCAQLASLSTPPPAPSLTPDQAAGLLGALRDSEMPVRARRDALRQVIDYVVPWPGRDGLDVYLLY